MEGSPLPCLCRRPGCRTRGVWGPFTVLLKRAKRNAEFNVLPTSYTELCCVQALPCFITEVGIQDEESVVTFAGFGLEGGRGSSLRSCWNTNRTLPSRAAGKGPFCKALECQQNGVSLKDPSSFSSLYVCPGKESRCVSSQVTEVPEIHFVATAYETCQPHSGGVLALCLDLHTTGPKT